MSNNLIKQKNIEKRYNEKYFNSVYGNNFSYLETKLDIPDCYIECNGLKFAVELTTYFMQDDEKDKAILKRSVAKLLEKDNWLYEAYKHLGKLNSQTINIHYRNKEDMIKDVLQSKDYIKHIRIGNNAWFYTKDKDRINCYLMNTNRQRLKLEEFIKYVNFIESDENHIYIELFKKKKYNFSTELTYYKYTLNKKDKCVDYSYVYWENEITKCQSIKKSIDKKLNKYEEYNSKLRENNITYDKYILIIYPEQYPIDIEDFDELYKKIKKQINKFKYDEIGIFLFNKILILNNTEYKVYDI